MGTREWERLPLPRSYCESVPSAWAIVRSIADRLSKMFPNSRIVDVRHLDKLAAGIHPVGSPENMNLRKALVRSPDLFYKQTLFPVCLSPSSRGMADVHSGRRLSSPSSHPKTITSEPLRRLTTPTLHSTAAPTLGTRVKTKPTATATPTIPLTSVLRSTFFPNHSTRPPTPIYSISNPNFVKLSTLPSSPSFFHSIPNHMSFERVRRGMRRIVLSKSECVKRSGTLIPLGRGSVENGRSLRMVCRLIERGLGSQSIFWMG